MTEPELIHTDWSLFQADGHWYPIGRGIEVMAYMHMVAGTFYIRAAERSEASGNRDDHHQRR